MFDSKSKTVKVVGYIIIGFFTLIITISFGMPDFISRLGLDQNIVAVVNGEKLHRLDYLRYRERFSHLLKESNKKEMENMILDNFIMKRLIFQEAKGMGIKVSDLRVKNSIKGIPYFRDKAGKFDNKLFKRYLEYSHQSLADFYITFEEDLIIDEMRQMLDGGVGVSPDDVQAEYTIDSSKIQIKYCFISSKDLKKKFKSRIAVSDKEIDDELKKDKGEVKDPKSDRNRIKKKLTKKKFEKIKSEIARKIDSWAHDKKSFTASASYLGGKITESDVFKIGEQVKQKGKKGRPVYAINNSQIFKEDCLSIGIGKTSRAINAYDGIYVFTPVKKNINVKAPSQGDYKKIADRLTQEMSNAVFMSFMSSSREKSKITKSLKFD